MATATATATATAPTTTALTDVYADSFVALEKFEEALVYKYEHVYGDQI
jgi:hypothetical protein